MLQSRMDAGSVRIVAILESIARSETPVSTDSIARAANVSRATVYRLLAALCEAGLLLREPKGAGFSVGPRLGALALSVMSSAGFRNARHSILQSLVNRIGETCNFTTYHQGAVLYVDRVEAAWPLRLVLQPGSTTPIHCTSSGKLYLSQMSARERRRFLYDAPIPRFTPKTITDPKLLESELQSVRRLRVAFDDQGYLEGLVSAAVPVYAGGRDVIGTVSVHGPLPRLTLERAHTVVPDLRRAAAELGDSYRRLTSWRQCGASGQRR
jgi:DNA-binding IclR family transcriptional regulator